MRTTRLNSPIELSSDYKIADTFQDNKDNDLEASQNTKNRDSITKR